MKNTNSLLKLEFNDEHFDIVSDKEDCNSVEFEIITLDRFSDARKEIIVNNIADIDSRLSLIENEVASLNTEIDKLTNHADGLDYTIAVASGVVTGLLDAFFVGEWDFKNAKASANKNMNELIMSKAKEEGYTGNRLDGAIAKLEEKYKLPGDNDWKGANIGVSAASHHLDDFAHHPTPVGLICSILSQFTEQAFYSNKSGELSVIPITVNQQNKFVGKSIPAKLFCGVINWCLAVVRTSSNWKGHLMSDMAGSKATAGAGMGIPGPMLSTLKEISALPIFNDTDLPLKIHKAYTKGIGQGKGQLDLGAFNVLFEGASSKMDMRTENAIKHELGRQAVPVLINEAIVRGFYFIRRLCMELKEHRNLENVNWSNVLPFKNRTIARMLTISTGTFMTVDLADAGIRAVIKSGGFNPMALEQFILRVNFVGVGRFAIAVTTDAGMGIKRGLLENRYNKLKNEEIYLLNAKVFYKNAEVWIEAEDTGRAILELQETFENAVCLSMKYMADINDSLYEIDESIDALRKNDTEFADELLLELI